MKYFAKFFLGIFLLDIIIAAIILFWAKPDPSMAIIEVLVIPLLSIINLILGLYLITTKKLTLSYLLFFNIFVSALVFKTMLTYWYVYSRYSEYYDYTFTMQGNNYEILFQKNNLLFVISDVTNQQNGSTTSIMMGDYKIKNDSIFLSDTQQNINCFIYNNYLFKFKESTDPILLIKK